VVHSAIFDSSFVTSFLFRKRGHVLLNTDRVFCRMPVLNFNNFGDALSGIPQNPDL